MGSYTTATGAWLARLLFSGVLLLTTLTTSAQLTWTSQSAHALGDVNHHNLLDVAYGAGRYVAVGEYGVIRLSTDGFVWTTKADGTQQDQGLAGIVYANGRFVAVGHKGRILTSTDGLTWSPATSGTTESLTGIAYDGGKLVAVGWKGIILTSSNGLSWTIQTANPAYIFTSVAYGGGQFVVGDAHGRIITSPNGINWTNQTVPISGFQLTAITAGTNGGLVAVGGGNVAVVLTSPDGVTWTYRPVSGTQTMLRGVAYDPTQHLYVATAGPDKLVWSADGNSWTTIPPGVESGLFGLRYINGRFIGLGESGIIRSSVNGTTWRALTMNENITFSRAAFGNNRYVAVGGYGVNTDKLHAANVAITSTDGKQYEVGQTAQSLKGGKFFYDVAFGAGLFAAVGEDGIIQTSADGKAWTARQFLPGQSTVLRAVAYGAGRFVAVGDKGFISRSVDGVTWQLGYMGLAGPYNGIAYANGQFVAVGTFGAIATSADGVVWTARSSGTNRQFKSVAYGAGLWLALGYDGIACWSSDGIHWKNYVVDANVYFNQVLFANGQFVAVALGGKLFTFPNALIGKAMQSGTTNHLWGIAYGNGLFIAVGENTTILTSPNAKAPSSAQGRLGLDEPAMILQVVAYPNPIQTEFTVAIDGVTGQSVQLQLVDMQGHTITSRQVEVVDAQHRESMSLGQQEPGIYLLQVSTPTQSQTIKLLKQ